MELFNLHEQPRFHHAHHPPVRLPHGFLFLQQLTRGGLPLCRSSQDRLVARPRLDNLHKLATFFGSSPVQNFMVGLMLESGSDRHRCRCSNMSRSEFRSFMERLSSSYHGDTYHLIAKNCNHFTDDVCFRLTGKPIPGWVNRLARVGSFCNCLLPENIQVQAVSHVPDHPVYSDYDSDSASNGSKDSHGEDPNHRLLTTPNSDIAYLKDKPVILAKQPATS